MNPKGCRIFPHLVYITGVDNIMSGGWDGHQDGAVAAVHHRLQAHLHQQSCWGLDLNRGDSYHLWMLIIISEGCVRWVTEELVVLTAVGRFKDDIYKFFWLGLMALSWKTCNRGASSASKTLNIIKIVCNWECTLYLQPGDLMKFFGISSIIQYESSVKYK